VNLRLSGTSQPARVVLLSSLGISSSPMHTDLSTQRVAVTGAAGFIGLHLLHGLHAAGAEVVAIVVAGKPTPGLDALPFPVERIVIESDRGAGDAIRQVRPRYVVHLSAVISLERSFRMIEQTIEANIFSTISLLTACTEVKAERVILMGSCEEYGQRYCPFDATLAPDPNSPYGASKAAATAYARMFFGSFGLPTVVLRPSVVYGPRQSPRQLISMVLEALAENRTIAVTEGRQTRDFVYVDDVVDAILIALTAPNVAGETWNIGSGEVVTVRHCLELVERITGLTGLIQYGARPYAESERFHYEPMVEETYRAFKWKPSVMLEEGIVRTWQSVLNKA
jgi:UDP-glucose 4-epimerase